MGPAVPRSRFRSLEADRFLLWRDSRKTLYYSLIALDVHAERAASQRFDPPAWTDDLPRMCGGSCRRGLFVCSSKGLVHAECVAGQSPESRDVLEF